ncbi:hypothetical protein Tco_0117202 [Tanacetum coccineum]
MKKRSIKLYRSALKCETIMRLGKPLLRDKLMTYPSSEASSGGSTGNWIFNNKEHGKASAAVINPHHKEFLLLVILLLRAWTEPGGVPGPPWDFAA